MSPLRASSIALTSLVLLASMTPLSCSDSEDSAANSWGDGGDVKTDGAAGAAGGAGAAIDGSLGGDAHAGSAGESAAGSAGSEQGGSAGSAQGGAAGGSAADAAPDVPADVSFGYDAPVYDSALTQDSACAATTAEAKPIPLDLYLILDSTGSMGTDCNVGSTTASKWCRAVNSIAGFVNDASSAGMRMALQFYSSSINATCSGSYYATPKVALGLLPANAGPIVSALNAQAPSGLTPTEAALRGIASFTKSKQTAGRVMIGILVTDGNPTDCSTNDTTLASIVGNHLASTGIKTFIVGMTGALSTRLETIAVAGGAPSHTNYCDGVASCHYYSVGDGNPQAFIAALKQIQQSAIACTYQMPTSDAGIIDPSKVTVQYTPGGGAPQELQHVDSKTQCVGNGWYYDNNTAPTLIMLCPDACKTVQADTNAKVEILLGCLGS